MVDRMLVDINLKMKKNMDEKKKTKGKESDEKCRSSGQWMRRENGHSDNWLL